MTGRGLGKERAGVKRFSLGSMGERHHFSLFPFDGPVKTCTSPARPHIILVARLIARARKRYCDFSCESRSVVAEIRTLVNLSHIVRYEIVNLYTTIPRDPVPGNMLNQRRDDGASWIRGANFAKSWLPPRCIRGG